MPNNPKHPCRCEAAVAFAVLATLAGPASASCGSAFCSVATTYDALGIRVDPGFRLVNCRAGR
ncbi:MAG: hypothetical protein U1E63_11555 [Burkholderiales bacterium]